MATSSKYIQLSSSVLMEYIYADQSVINTAGNPYRFITTTTPIWKLSNTHDNIDTILNADSSEFIQSGLPIGTGNVRNRAYAFIDNYKSALLDIDRITPYNDYDSSLTPTPNLPITFTTPQAPVYDTIRLHLVQGFNFEQYEGLTLNLKANKKDGKPFNLLNFVFNKRDTFEVMNPDSFFFAGRVYDSYLEVKVLSLYNLIYDYWLGTLNGDTVAERITDQVGIQREQPIQIAFSWIRERKTVDGQDYIYLYDTMEVDIPTQDQFESIAAEISESSSGDYIEFFATYKGDIIENFILDLNSSGYDYILLHDLVVSEYIYDSSNDSYYWQKTDDLQLSQTGDYDLPNTFRPVIKNTSAISFKIDYTVRLYNRNDNSQIWKNSSMVSNSASKYGRRLLQLNLGTNPVQPLIYNKNVVKDIQINRIQEPVLDNAKYITSFLDNTQISVSFDTINPDSNTSNTPNTLPQVNQNYASGGAGNTIYSNGLARILVAEAVSYLKFVIYQNDAATDKNVAMNLSGIGSLVLSFISTDGSNLDVLEYPSTFTSKTNGEIVFRLTEQEAKRVLSFVDRQFRIYLINQKGERTFLYNGRYYNQTEWLNLAEANKVASVEKNLDDMITVNTTLMAQVKNQADLIDQLTKNISVLQQQLSAEADQNGIESTTITNQKMQIDSQKSTIDTLNKMIVDLNSSLSLAQSKVLTEEGMVASLQKQLASQSIILGATSMNITQETVKEPPFNEKALEAIRANINNSPATTFTMFGGGGFGYNAFRYGLGPTGFRGLRGFFNNRNR